MLKNTLIAFLLCSTLTLLALVFVEHRARSAAEAQVAEIQRAADVRAQRAEALLRPGTMTVTKVSAERTKADGAAVEADAGRDAAVIRDLRNEISLLQAGRSRGPALTPRVPNTLERAVLHQLLGSAETAGIAMDWIKADQYQRYAALIERQTQLTPAQREELRGLLAERYATRMDVAVAGGPEAVPDANKKELDAEYHRRLAALVGESEAELFARVETKPVSWERIQKFEDRLRYEATPLDREQLTTLWPVLSSGVFWYKPPGSPTELDALIAQRAEANTKVLAQAKPTLQPAQYATLERPLRDDAATWQVQLRANLLARTKVTPPNPPKG